MESNTPKMRSARDVGGAFGHQNYIACNREIARPASTGPVRRMVSTSVPAVPDTLGILGSEIGAAIAVEACTELGDAASRAERDRRYRGALIPQCRRAIEDGGAGQADCGVRGGRVAQDRKALVEIGIVDQQCRATAGIRAAEYKLHIGEDWIA
jgi:hypothetical protein